MSLPLACIYVRRLAFTNRAVKLALVNCRRWTAFFVIYLLGTYLGAAVPKILDPKSYPSPSGHYVLEIDPSQIDGHGPGAYRLAKDRQELWSKTLPFTFLDSVVLDDGGAIGYFYEHREKEFPQESRANPSSDAIHVVVLTPKGGVRSESVVPRIPSPKWHASSEPIFRKLLLSPKQDQFTVCVEDGEAIDIWKTYQCSTGKFLRQFELRKASVLPPWTSDVKSIEPIKGTPLVLVESWGHISLIHGAQEPRLNCTLLTQDGRSVWSQDVPIQAGFRQVTNPDRFAFLERKGAILDVTQYSQFDLWFFGESRRVTFTVARDSKSKSGWKVQETRRDTYRPWEVEAPLAAVPPSLSLPPLGTFQLQNPGDNSKNLSGAHVAARDDGSIFLQESSLGDRKPGVLEFDPSGNRLGFREFTGATDQRCYAQPGTKNLLVLATHFAGLVGPDNTVLKAIERRADRRWLDKITGVAFAGDGSFVMQSESSENLGADPALTFFTPDAAALQTLPLPNVEGSLFGYNGTHFLLRSRKTIEIYDRQANPVQSFPVPIGYESSYMLTRDGRELWCINLSSRTVDRFAMP